MTGSNRMRRYTPAVTRVEECTREDTGVGAAIAAGSQAEKGTWALFVRAASLMRATEFLGSAEVIKFHDPMSRLRPIAIKIRTSPSRLVRAVSILALLDFSFW